MKKSFYSILAVLSVFAMLAAGCSTDADDGPTGDPPGQVTVTFDADGGTPTPPAQTFASGGKATEPTGVTKANSTLDGWFNGETKWNFASDTVTASITLKAKWTANAAGTFTVTFNKNHSDAAGTFTEANPTQKPGGASGVGTLPTAPTRTGYTFSKWTAAQNGTGAEFTATTAVTAAITVYAQWTASGTPPGGSTTPNFDAAEAIKALEGGSASTVLKIDTTTGIISRDNTAASEYGNLVSITIPGNQTVAANSIITLEYIATAEAKLILKKPGTYNDINPATTLTFTGGDELPLRTLTIEAVRYEGTITNKISFQSPPPAAPWKLKITNITVAAGADLAAALPVPDLKPVAGGTPETAVTTQQYTGTVVWTVTSNGTAHSGAFAAGTAYTATITLAAATGYTFEGIAANAIKVTGTEDATHAAGTGKTLVITANFASTLAPPDPFTLEFEEGDVIGRMGTVTLESDGYGFTYESTGDNYERAWAYFKVTFPAGYSLSDYSHIAYKITGSSPGTPGDSGWKDFFINAYADEDDVLAIFNATGEAGKLPTTEQIAGGDNSVAGIEALNVEKTRTLPITIKNVDGKEVWLAVRTAAKTGFAFKLTDITFSYTAPEVVEP